MTGPLSPLTLATSRPALLTFAVGPFMARDKFPELVRRYIFQLWRADARRAKRQSENMSENIDAGVTDVTKDAEASITIPSDSKQSAALFGICIEELGVTPPPLKGWVPQKNNHQPSATAVAAASTNRSEGGEDSQQEWWANPGNGEWLYHHKDQMYFHLPSSTLWERRDLDEEAPHLPQENRVTFFRSDNTTLQALALFASHLTDGKAMVPVTLKAWVRFTRKNKKKKVGSGPNVSDRGTKAPIDEQPVPPEAPQVDPAPKPAEQPKELPDIQDMGLVKPAEANDANGVYGTSEGNNVAKDNGNTFGGPVAADDVRLRLVSDGEEVIIPSPPDLTKLSAGDKINSQGGNAAYTSGGSGNGAYSALSSPAPKKKRGWFFCFRGKRQDSNGGYGSDTSSANGSFSPAGFSVLVEEDGGGSKNNAKPEKSSDSAKNGHMSPKVHQQHAAKVHQQNAATHEHHYNSADEMPTEWHSAAHSKYGLEINERHVRRIDQFYKEVKNNPSKLVNHIERRRVDKTHMAYVVGANHG